MGLAEIILRGRGLIIVTAGAISVLAGVFYFRLEVANNVDAWFSPDDPRYRRYVEFRERFVGEDTLYVVIRAPDLFTRDVLGCIDRLTRTIAALPQVTRTVSLTKIEDIRGSAQGIEIAPLVPTVDVDRPPLHALRARVLADPFFPGRIVSPDGRTTAIVAEIGRRTVGGNAAVVDAVEAAVAQVAAPGLEIHVAGWPAVGVLMDRLTIRDQRWAFPVTVVILSCLLAVAFGSPRTIVVIIAAVFLSILWTMGAFAALGFRGTVVTVSALPGILLALTLATAVHVVARFREEQVLAREPREAMRRALGGVALPVLLTCATTAVGFGSLVVAEIMPVRHLSLFAAFGMAVTCVMCLSVLPAALLALPWGGHLARHRWLERGLGWVAAFDVRHRRAILVVSLVLAVAGAAGATQLRPQSSSLHYLPSDSEPVEAMRFIEEHFGGASDIEVLVSGPPGVFKDPRAARVVESVERLLASYPEVTATFAYTDLLRRMNQALHAGNPEFYRLPQTRRGIAQQLLLYETSGGGELSALVDVSSYDSARVTGRLTSFLELDDAQRLYQDIGARLQGLVPVGGPSLRLAISGDGALWLRLNLSLLDTMVKSFGLALFGISLMMVLLARSIRIGLMAMIPNVLPVLVAVGAMGWVGIELDFATIMIACIALGVAVDDTIHYLVWFRRELGVDSEPVAAMRRTLTTVGKAMVSTSVVLCVGMGSMIASGFPPHRTFGAIMAVTMVFALAGDLFLLPVLLSGRRILPPARPATRGARLPHSAPFC